MNTVLFKDIILNCIFATAPEAGNFLRYCSEGEKAQKSSLHNGVDLDLTASLIGL